MKKKDKPGSGLNPNEFHFVNSQLGQQLYLQFQTFHRCAYFFYSQVFIFLQVEPAQSANTQPHSLLQMDLPKSVEFVPERPCLIHFWSFSRDSADFAVSEVSVFLSENKNCFLEAVRSLKRLTKFLIIVLRKQSLVLLT